MPSRKGLKKDEPWPDVPDARRRTMSAVRGKDTKAELRVRSLLHKLGYRFRLHARDIPGRPDVIFRGRRKVIFIHGCFWHSHEGCRHSNTPRTRTEYWGPKLQSNKARDLRVKGELEQLGIDALTIWECEVPLRDVLAERLKRFLGPTRVR